MGATPPHNQIYLLIPCSDKQTQAMGEDIEKAPKQRYTCPSLSLAYAGFLFVEKKAYAHAMTFTDILASERRLWVTVGVHCRSVVWWGIME